MATATQSATTSAANTQSATTLAPTANHIGSRLHFPIKRKTSAPIGIKVDPAECQSDVTVANATVTIRPTSDNPLANLTRKINILQRQNTIDDKGGSGNKIAQGKINRSITRPIACSYIRKFVLKSYSNAD